MFDIGFSELILVAVVAVVVIGPDKLPETVRTIALWLGRLRRMASRLYQEVEKEVGMDDIRRQLHNEEILQRLDEQARKMEAEQSAATSQAATSQAAPSKTGDIAPGAPPSGHQAPEKQTPGNHGG
jgi:sec-independent protein translocase protein TatB